MTSSWRNTSITWHRQYSTPAPTCQSTARTKATRMRQPVSQRTRLLGQRLMDVLTRSVVDTATAGRLQGLAVGLEDDARARDQGRARKTRGNAVRDRAGPLAHHDQLTDLRSCLHPHLLDQPDNRLPGNHQGCARPGNPLERCAGLAAPPTQLVPQALSPGARQEAPAPAC